MIHWLAIDEHPHVVIPHEVKLLAAPVLESGNDLCGEEEVLGIHGVRAANASQREVRLKKSTRDTRSIYLTPYKT